MQADIKNRNGRIYPMEVLEKEVKKIQQRPYRTKEHLVKLGHPEGPTINLERASHMITSLNQMVKTLSVKQRYYQLLWVRLLKT